MANHDKRITVCNGSHSQIAQRVHVSPATRYARLDPLEKVELLATIRGLVTGLEKVKKGGNMKIARRLDTSP